MRHIGKFLLLLAGLVFLDRSSANQTIESPEHQSDLLELYTSEGCSSCPPAEAWMANLRAKPGLWTKFVPVAFHVDYWNYLGWPDRFSSPDFTERQRAYAASWGSENIYTPEFVLNGSEWRRQGNFPTDSNKSPGRLKLYLDETGGVTISFHPAPDLRGPFKVTVVPLAMGVVTIVKRGENSGRTLRHDFLALGIREVELKQTDDGTFRGQLALPLNKEASVSALAAWVSSPGIPVIQAAGGLIGTATAED